ncbi:hypothetical protein [Campylobacter devanensis]|uniref:hypothetical protein n=1 Tax=Campylobacter devanensis TaxID=3161138 RepID=UPI000A33D8BC|nr:hypothetical protein [Campylobacter sp. P157]
MKNLLLVLAFGFCLIGCSSKPSCSDEEVIRLVKERVLENNGWVSEDIIYENDNISISSKRLFISDEFIKEKPISIMTVNDSDDRVVQCRVKFANNDEFVNFSAQYTDDGDLYVELQNRRIIKRNF